MPPSNPVPVAAGRDSGNPVAVLAAFRVGSLGNETADGSRTEP